MKISFLCICLISILSLPAFSPAADAGATAANHGSAQNDQYERSMEERFRKLGKNLDELQAQARALAEQARREAERSLADAEQKRKEAGRKLDEMRTEGKKRWDTFTNEMNVVMDEFEKAYERARERVRRGEKGGR